MSSLVIYRQSPSSKRFQYEGIPNPNHRFCIRKNHFQFGEKYFQVLCPYGRGFGSEYKQDLSHNAKSMFAFLRY